MAVCDVSFIGGRGIFANYGGVENATREIVLEMSKQTKININVYGVKGTSDNTFKLPKNVRTTNILNIFYKVFGQHGFILLCVLHAILIRRPKVVVLFASGPCVFTPLIRVAGIKVITSLRAIDSARDKWGMVSRNILKLGEYCSWRFSNEFTANSKEMVTIYKKFRPDAHFVPNGSKKSTSANEDILVENDIRKNGYFLFAARLDPVKRLHLLLEAHSNLSDSERIPLVIAGGNVKDPEYERQLKEYQCESVIFLGHITSEHLDPLMQNCRAFILPSVLEGMSNSILSAMANNKATLVADIPENRDVVLLDDALFKRDDLDDLSKKLKILAIDKAFCEKLGNKLGCIAEENYSWVTTSNLFWVLINKHL
ncbi:glycosyltransferase family 4 protein [Algibacillus agarilyticus]|uniref:glycosyltransferase family 4 protein n=1 Tax=Algibacillus agarilyticus TaxID=2234133 RepID=UPI000DD03ACD|nr:glycosyltransferase family 4 protein [Algibacillus agarilyticus]